MIQPVNRISIFLLLFCVLLVLPQVTAISLSPGNSFSGAPTIANGDPVYIHGIATGHPLNGLQIWLLGNNYVKISTVSTNADNSYEYELKPADTSNLLPGQYFLLIQHPMMNGVFDIYYNAATGTMINRQIGTGTSIFQLKGADNVQSPASANALMQAIYNQNIDDTFVTTSFIVSSPATTSTTIATTVPTTIPNTAITTVPTTIPTTQPTTIITTGSTTSTTVPTTTITTRLTTVVTTMPTSVSTTGQTTSLTTVPTLPITTSPTSSVEKLLEEQNKKIDEQNRLIAEQNTKMSEQNDLLSQLLNYFKGIFGWK